MPQNPYCSADVLLLTVSLSLRILGGPIQQTQPKTDGNRICPGHVSPPETLLYTDTRRKAIGVEKEDDSVGSD